MTSTPQPIAGLYQLIARKRAGAAWQRENDDSTIGQHAAVRSDAEADKLESHAHSNVDLINAMEIIIHDLTTSSIQSAPRTLALRELESASMRLRRELGDQPTD